jgi:hypothetical protein
MKQKQSTHSFAFSLEQGDAVDGVMTSGFWPRFLTGVSFSLSVSESSKERFLALGWTLFGRKLLFDLHLWLWLQLQAAQGG